MTNQNKEKEILKKAIDKALENGWSPWWKNYSKRSKNGIKARLEFKDTLEGLVIQITDKGDYEWDGYCRGGLLDWSNGYVVTVLKPESILLNKDFAKAFWGEEKIKDGSDLRCYCGEFIPYLRTVPVWQYHLQQMVLKEDPIKYLEQFI